ncbi:gamma-glutamyl-gamma-aminobutyrate hydrolase family protein [Streptomyces sp. NBC_01003]|uniref:gamma-glutamyl-gamma-aminobutyrate hydrolase family protein n=1 Tax=Streptomyces sp. NBC_01003 TaxID=2903714 RepID=UPI00386D26AF|nr:gamma-glutamyl-gamma-aminobutyrate hydrolase family protein [Streptomyces sp. NBC_01003]
MAAHSDAGFPARRVELALLRQALAAEVPVLGVCLGARLLAVAAGGAARTGSGSQLGWGEVRTGPAADRDPLFAGAPERLRVPHRHGDTRSPRARRGRTAREPGAPAPAGRRLGRHPGRRAPPLCFPRSCKRAAGLRARHGCSPLSRA